MGQGGVCVVQSGFVGASEVDLVARVRELEQQLDQKRVQLGEFRSHLEQANQQLQQVLRDVRLYIQAVHKLHHELVPTRVAQISGFEFSYKFVPGEQGGDFFDVAKIENSTKFAVLLTSCQDYNVSARLLSTLLGCPLAQLQVSPQEFADQILKAAQSQGQAHLFCAVVDRRNFMCRYARRGGPICWHQSRATNKIINLQHDNSCQLEPRDKIILGTPGLVDVQNSRGEAFGPQRLQDIAHKLCNKGAHELRHEILFQLDNWQKQGADAQIAKPACVQSAGNKPAGDTPDRSLFVCEVQDKVVRLDVARSKD